MMKRGADCDTDHFLVKAKLQFDFHKLKPMNRVKVQRWSTSDLKRNEQVIEKYQKEIEENLHLNTTNDIESHWLNIRDTITKVAEKEIGTAKLKR